MMLIYELVSYVHQLHCWRLDFMLIIPNYLYSPWSLVVGDCMWLSHSQQCVLYNWCVCVWRYFLNLSRVQRFKGFFRACINPEHSSDWVCRTTSHVQHHRAPDTQQWVDTTFRFLFEIIIDFGKRAWLFESTFHFVQTKKNKTTLV